jgi:hypothetical protein
MISFSSHPFANLFTTFFFYRRNERIVMGNWNGFNNQTILSWIPIETKFFWLPKNSSFYYYFFVGFSIKFPHFLIQINSTSHLQNDKWKRSFFFHHSICVLHTRTNETSHDINDIFHKWKMDFDTKFQCVYCVYRFVIPLCSAIVILEMWYLFRGRNLYNVLNVECLILWVGKLQ